MLPHRDREDRRMERKIRKEETGRRGPRVTRLHLKLMGPVAEVEDTFPCARGAVVNAVFSVPGASRFSRAVWTESRYALSNQTHTKTAAPPGRDA